MKTSVFALSLLGGVSIAAIAVAQEAHQLDPVSVSGSEVGGALVVSDPQPTPKSTITKAGIDLLGGPAQVSSYKPFDLMPSVMTESPDPFGLSPTRNMNVRGKGNFHLSTNVDGLPLAGIVGGADLFDLENVEQMDIYRGGMPAGQGLGISNASGSIDQRLLRAQDKFGVQAKQAYGSYDFRKSFARLDTGALPETGTRTFVSLSSTANDKWKGSGDQDRTNAMLGVSQELGERVKVDLAAVYNKYSANTYRSLSYAQTKNLKDNYRYDYNTTLTGTNATDVNYFDFNRSQYENYATLAAVDVTLAANHHLLFKPYYWNSNGVTYGQTSSGGAGVQVWHQQNDNLGGVFEYNGNFSTGTQLSVGHWVQQMAAPPPPTDQKKYTVTANGGLNFANWMTLAKIDPYIVNSPYVQATQAIGKTTLSGGLRYMILGAPSMQYYNTAGLPNVSYDQVWGYNPTPYADAAVRAKDYAELLPNIGLRHEISPEWSASASYARKFGRPDWGPQASNYINNRAAFQAKGVSLQTLVDKVKPELSDAFDVSARYSAGGLTVVPTLFFAKNQNRQVKVVDPAISNLSYYQGTAETTQYGAELEVSYEISNTLTVFGSATQASETYDADTPTLAGGAIMGTKGRQIPNAPQTMLKGGLTYRWADLSLSPVVRYIGDRYGDSGNVERMKAYTVADFSAGYDLGKELGLNSLSAGLAVLNVFNRRYVSEVAPSDFDLSASSSYYVGAPRTIVGTVSVKF